MLLQCFIGTLSNSTVNVHCITNNAGAFAVVVHPSWAPLGAKRFLDLVEDRFYDGVAFMRMNRMMVQFGISPNATKVVVLNG